ncbi:hypothetical protein V8E51_006395 [Hyaloscypha variabilis]
MEHSPNLASSQSPVERGTQVSPLRALKRHITTHDPCTSRATFQSSVPAEWKSVSGSNMGFQTIYCTSMSPPSLNNDLDLTLNTQLTPNVGLSIPGGTVSRVVDFAPGFETTQHRTQSLDLGVVIEGTVELVLDSGERRIMGAGDTIVQRGTRHAWRNASESDWARMFFVLISCEPVKVGGNVLEEDHGDL